MRGTEPKRIGIRSHAVAPSLAYPCRPNGCLPRPPPSHLGHAWCGTLPSRMTKRIWITWLSVACLAILAIGAAWRLADGGEEHGQVAGSTPSLEIRWHGGGIVLQGAVRDSATQHALAQAAAERLGGETDQVTDWLDIKPTGLVVADPAALARLIRLGQEGWHLQRQPAEARLAVQSLADTRSAQAQSLLQSAFGPGVSARLVPLP